MTYTGGEYSLEDLFRQLEKQARSENVSNYEEYIDLVDNIIEEKKSYGFLVDEEDLEQFKHDLELRWPEIEKHLLNA
ncbi:MAG: hypothetical protein US25_C0003G0014 [Candidatus Moranbacteria bacterium GW2011_GWE1_36_7]|nr:MAG: hypothetical protein UR99_C0014G0014 [Candidatus Moranbacteria bacterium GW2011_GWD2_36_12]KKQ06446.1 MAG: hypothetical protein US16_C0017G0014 [Candidatus Moranbacteria bacterium GW2011_GWE2_36_40]KKQ15496.1 MAG: hypothetical protein US25_C0003G0014 [Candidatus Moranbacteria bacterium GW2011_GWE1_36_7]